MATTEAVSRSGAVSNEAYAALATGFEGELLRPGVDGYEQAGGCGMATSIVTRRWLPAAGTWPTYSGP
jgi:hypothetical protein